MALAVLVLASLSLPSLASSSASSGNPPPRITIQQLRSASTDHSRGNLHRLLYDSHGILRISVGGDGDDEGRSFSDLRKSALSHMCDCPTLSPPDGGSATFEEALKSYPKNLQQIDLPDGTVRRTLATATVGFDGQRATALELPSWVQDACGLAAHESLEDLRDAVADVVESFVQRLDQEKESSVVGALDENLAVGGEEVQSYRKILSSANHLEHFHVYTKSSQEDNQELGEMGGRYVNDEKSNATSTLDYHTDAGFFLSFVPAMNCHSYTTDDSSFYMKEQHKPIEFQDDEVVIMMGAGAQHWLPSREHSAQGKGSWRTFLAASHALRLSQDTHRTWYGKMHLLPSWLTPSDITPQSASSLKYGDALPSFELNDYNAHVPTSPVDGCGTTAFNEDPFKKLILDANIKKGGRRRLQHVDSPSECNNQTNFFCWKQCIELPEAKYAEQYVQDGYSLYCLDPGLLSSSDSSIQDATEPCQGGYVHNSNCLGFWQATDENVLGYKLPYEVKETENDNDNSSANQRVPESGDGYCYGGTSMYMDGFNWQGTTCVVYLFQSWILSTPGKFAAAAVGTIFFGISMEFVLWKRRSVYALPPGALRLCMSSLVYGLQLAMGYLIMLVVMTYSGPLFICCLAGMMLGHAFFNAQDSLAKQYSKKKAHVGSDETEAANGEGSSASQGKTSHTSVTELSTYQNGKSNQNGGTNHDSLENGNALKSPPPKANKDATEKTKLNDVPGGDGVTPCCQYYVDED